MTQRSFTAAQLSGYRFLIRRLRSALIQQDTTVLHDPLRSESQALFLGCVMTVMLCILSLVISVIKPNPGLVGKKIVVNRDTGAIYVETTHGIFHPIMNLASAELILGSKFQQPTKVSAESLATIHLGPLLGIIGAPVSINSSLDAQNSWWTLCDERPLMHAQSYAAWSPPRVVEIISRPNLTVDMKSFGKQEAILVASPNGQIYMLYGNKRLKLNLSELELLTVLQGSEMRLTIRSISYALLDAIPEGHSLDVLKILQADYSLPFPILGKLRSGQIISAKNISGAQSYYVVLRQGIQPVPLFIAQLIEANTMNHPIHMRTKQRANFKRLLSLPMSLMKIIPRVPDNRGLNVDDYPTKFPTLRSNQDRSERFLCLVWHKNTDNPRSEFFLASGSRLPLPQNIIPVSIVSSSHNGKGADQVAIPPMSGEYVYSINRDLQSQRSDALFYISDTGVRYAIGDKRDAVALGLNKPKAVPWEFLQALTAGPLLSHTNALMQYERVNTDAQGIPLHLTHS